MFWSVVVQFFLQVFFPWVLGWNWIRAKLEDRKDTLKLDRDVDRLLQWHAAGSWVECGCSSLLRPLLATWWCVDRGFLPAEALSREWSGLLWLVLSCWNFGTWLSQLRLQGHPVHT